MKKENTQHELSRKEAKLQTTVITCKHELFEKP